MIVFTEFHFHIKFLSLSVNSVLEEGRRFISLPFYSSSVVLVIYGIVTKYLGLEFMTSNTTSCRPQEGTGQYSKFQAADNCVRMSVICDSRQFSSAYSKSTAALGVAREGQSRRP